MSASAYWLNRQVVTASGDIPVPPDIIGLLHKFFPDSFVIGALYRFEYPIYCLVAIGFVFLFFRAASRNAGIRPNRIQASAEILLEALLNLVEGILGPKEGRRYFPFLASLFIFILFMNFEGLIPLLKAPTSNIKVTAALAICVFLFVQYTAVTRLGPKNFVLHLMGEPKDAIGWALVPLFLPLHILEELIKPLSLACRLFGNVLGKEILLGVGLLLGIQLVQLAIPSTPVGLPLHFPFMFLAILLSAIQALIFMLLSTVYISMVLPHDDHH